MENKVVKFLLEFYFLIFMVLSGGGDFTIVLILLCHRFSGQEVVYIDHPYKAGVTAFER